ncbi:unnamed protein product, partial [Chrysoparadoxa australica]
MPSQHRSHIWVKMQVEPDERAGLMSVFEATDGRQWKKNDGWGTTSPLHGVTVEGGNVVGLDLSDNRLKGSIPAELGHFRHLQGLYLRNNKLSGSIPVELGQLSSLQELYLLENQLSGSIPAELGKLSGLQKLFLYNNQLS